MNKTWTVTIDENGILPLPEDLLIEAGWEEGDCLHWIDNRDGSWSLVKEELTSFIQKGIINDEQN
jgi:bifunctional DNA-binding transcriptional regulator/antitoxin component of YhaV-PrlF toxin-antitoxin module